MDTNLYQILTKLREMFQMIGFLYNRSLCICNEKFNTGVSRNMYLSIPLITPGLYQTVHYVMGIIRPIAQKYCGTDKVY